MGSARDLAEGNFDLLRLALGGELLLSLDLVAVRVEDRLSGLGIDELACQGVGLSLVHAVDLHRVDDLDLTRGERPMGARRLVLGLGLDRHRVVVKRSDIDRAPVRGHLDLALDELLPLVSASTQLAHRIGVVWKRTASVISLDLGVL